VCGDDVHKWTVLWVASWPVLFVGMVAFSAASGAPLGVAVAAAGLLVGLPGVLGPAVARPVGIDVPCMAVCVWSATCFLNGWWIAALGLLIVASTIKETSPLWVALWSWSPVPLLGVLVVAAVWFVKKPGMDPVTFGHPILKDVLDHPVKQSLAHHEGRWRDAWLMVAPWGVGLAALVSPSVQVVMTLLVAYGLLLVITDTVRPMQTTAGPVVCLAAASVIPPQFLLLAVVVHFFWWRQPELI
jgi:hypothetical protein